MDEELDGAGGALKARLGGLALVLAIATPLLWARIGTLPLLDPDEAKHAEVAREMLAAGRWLEPLVYGQPYHHKPSLLYLLIGLCYRAVGVGELGARIVPATAGLVAVVVAYFAGSRRRVIDGVTAALLLLAAPLFFAVARFTNFDGLLTLTMLTAILTAARWIEAPDEPSARRRLIAFAALSALGVLVKGPVAAVLLFVPVAWIGFATLKATPLATLARAAVVFVAVVSVWLVPTLVLHPDYVYDFLWVHNFERYSVDADLFHPEPFWYFAPVLLATLLPWSLLVPSALVAGWRRSARDRLLVVYALWVVVFFSASSGKLATYVLPAYPPLAILVATWLGDVTTREPARSATWLTRATAVIYLVVPAVVYFVIRHEEPGFESVAAGLLGLPLAALLVLRPMTPTLSSERGATMALALALLATYAVVLMWLSPVLGRFTSDKDLALSLAATAPPPDRVVVHKVRPFSFLFYSHWPLVYKVSDDEYRAALTGPGRVYVLSKRSRIATLTATDPPIELREIASNHRHVVFERVELPTQRNVPREDTRLP